MIKGINNQPYLDMAPYIDMAEFDRMQPEIIQGFALGVIKLSLVVMVLMIQHT